MEKTALVTTGEVAAHCRVSYETVNKWIKSGKLKAYTTPGRHHRIPAEDFREFLQRYHLPPLEQGPAPRRKVLIVDDDPHVVQVLGRFFGKAEEYEVAAAADGFEAGLQLARFCPDLVILDLMMPNIDGFAVCRKIRSSPETRDLRVLVITGYATDENIQRALECGADYCLAKPFAIGELEKQVEALFKGARRVPLTA